MHPVGHVSFCGAAMSFRYGDQPKTANYAHRNGEMDAPTEAGIYFFFGVVHDGPTMLANLYDADAENEQIGQWTELVRVSFHWKTKQPQAALLWEMFLKDNVMPLESLHGQWWGPIREPWRKAVTP